MSFVARPPVPLVLVTVWLAAAGTSAAGTLPAAPALLEADGANHGLEIKPATIVYTGDGSGFLGGADARDRNAGIAWTRWTSTTALGTGFNQLNDCEPDCAGGTYHGYGVRIELWRPRRLAGRLVFTRMTIFYEHGRPPGEPSHFTFTDTYTGGIGAGYGWGPPGAVPCAHTYGLPPDAGCANIHALP